MAGNRKAVLVEISNDGFAGSADFSGACFVESK